MYDELQLRDAPGRTLNALAAAGCITSEQLLTWRKLRNSVMHGETLHPYRSAKEDARLFQLMDIVRSLERGEVHRRDLLRPRRQLMIDAGLS